MKTRLKSLALAIVVVLLASCSKSEFDNPLLGSWLYTNVSMTGSQNSSDNYNVPCTEGCEVLTFYSNNTYTSNNGTKGKYVINTVGKILVLDASAPASFLINGNNLTVIWGSSTDRSLFSQSFVKAK